MHFTINKQANCNNKISIAFIVNNNNIDILDYFAVYTQ